MIKLETERLYIRDHKDCDLEPYHRLLSDNVSMKYLPDIKTKSLEESRESLKIAIDEASMNSNRTLFFLGIFLKDGTYIGEIGYTVSREKTVHLGYFIYRDYWNMGIVSEALPAVLKFAFNSGIEKIETGCLTDNKYSERLMIKNGFSRYEFKPEHTFIDGCLLDRVEYSLTLEDFLRRSRC